MERERLYKSKKDFVIAGVAGGIAEHLKTDSLLIRILFVVLALAGGGGVIIYFVLMIFLPERENINYTNMGNETNQGYNPNQNYKNETERNKKNGNLLGGLILITIGSLFLVSRFIPRIDFGDLWPIILIVIGISLIINGVSNKNNSDPKNYNQ